MLLSTFTDGFFPPVLEIRLSVSSPPFILHAGDLEAEKKYGK